MSVILIAVTLGLLGTVAVTTAPTPVPVKAGSGKKQ